MRAFLIPCFLIALVLQTAIGPALAARLWAWNYSGRGFSASGTFTTDDAPNNADLYRITGITGSRNGVSIAGLQPAGTPIPGNEPYPVDNLIRAGNPQLTGDGFGFALADGTFANAFFGESHTPQTYMEFFSSPAGKSGGGAKQSESPVVFSAEERR
jgi:hypothetical protein